MRPEQQLRGFLDRSSVTSELKSRGFRMSGLTWTLTNRGMAHVIDFQRSRFSALGSVKFTINVGIALEDIWRVYFGESLPRHIDEADCFPRFRVGEALGGFQGEAKDVWWTLVENDATNELGAEVRSALLETCLPILNRLDSVEAVCRFVQDEAPPRHPHPFTRIAFAIVCHLHGEPDRAEAELVDLERNSRIGEEWRIRIRDVRTRLGMVWRSGP